MTFEDTGLKTEIIRAISELGFETPSPIQAETIPHLLDSQDDLVGLAQTGTGKTAAFGLPLLHLLDTDVKKVQAIVLAPTRELGVQICGELDKYGKYLKDFKTVAVYGGADISKQIKALAKNPQIVVATPGRCIDLINRGKLRLDGIEYLVLDEADEMLNMGFKEDLDTILSSIPDTRQTLLFSATMPKEIARIAKEYMHNPHEIKVGSVNDSTKNVQHIYYQVSARDRYLALKRIADVNPNIYGIVFCRTRMETKDVADKLIKDGYQADALHGDLSQAQRDLVMKRFRNKGLQILVATDVAARGLDVNDLTHVINYILPDESETYIHRSGRTGRAGKHGISISLVNLRESGKIKTLEKKTSKKFEKKPIPDGHEICAKRLFALIDKVEKVEVNEEQILEYLDPIYKKLEWLSKEELISRFVSVEFNAFLDYYKNAPDLNQNISKDRDGGKGRDHDRGKGRDRDRGRDSRRRGDDANYNRFFINLGEKDNIEAKDILGMINSNTKGKIAIGNIDIMRAFSFFNADANETDQILQGLNNTKHNKRPIVVEVANDKKSKSKGNGKSKVKSKGRDDERPRARDGKKRKAKRKR